MIPSKFRNASGPNKEKSQQPQAIRRQQAPSPSMLGSAPANSSSNQGATSNRPHNNAFPSVQQGQSRPIQQKPPFPQSMTKQRNGGSPTATPSDPRKVLVDHIIRTCYSKTVLVNNRRVPEVKYNAHLGIRELSQYPSSPPPPELSPAEIGPVKNRILVVCTKHTGRVLLQKGKYNDARRVYQIGRTWDLDELQSITRVGPDAMILSLNKDYYWKSGEGPERLVKFVHHLCVIHHKFTGHYPLMKGFTLESLGLSSAPPIVGSTNQTERNREVPQDVQTQSTQERNVPKATPSIDHYKNLDFTVNGNLPLKQMQVMDVNRPYQNESSPFVADESTYPLSGQESAESQSFRNANDNNSVMSHDSFTNRSFNSPKKSVAQRQHASPDKQSVNDASSFIFSPDGVVDETQASMPTIQEHVDKDERQSPSRSYKSLKDSLEDVNATGYINPTSADGTAFAKEHYETQSSQSSIKFQFQLPDDTNTLRNNSEVISVQNSIISEVSESVPTAPSSGSARETHTRQGGDTSAIDTSIREIEDFMDTQFGKSARSSLEDTKRKSSPRKSLTNRLSQRYQLDENFIDLSSTRQSTGTATIVADSDAGIKVAFEKDPEVEELLDQIGWNATEGSDKCVKMLRKELTLVKHKNVTELTALDFGKDSVANEVKVSSSELENLIEIFKKMEVSFAMIAPRVNDIENNSKGLQVEAVNKKILYNELSGILSKVRVNTLDLQAVAEYNDFADLSALPLLEGKLLMLFDALGAIGSSSTEDDLSQMRALKQFHKSYESVALAFIQKFKKYIIAEFRKTMESLNNDIANIQTYNISEQLRRHFVLVGVNNFVKCISLTEFGEINDKFKIFMANFVDNLLRVRMRSIHSNLGGSKTPRSSQNVELSSVLKKGKSTRFGSTRLLSRIAGSNTDENSKITTTNSNEINDPRVVLRLVKESKELMFVVQFFFGNFFHLVTNDDFTSVMEKHPFNQRMKILANEDLEQINYKSNSNELLQNMNAIFGNYINKLTRELTADDLIVPHILMSLYNMLVEAEEKNQDFVGYSFLSKLIDRYENSWNRFITNQVDLFNKSDIRAKGGILPSVRNSNHIINTIEASLQESQNLGNSTFGITQLVNSTYKSLSKAATDLFDREDPLLKSNTHDEKERAHRNVAILQNLFYLLQGLNEHSSESSFGMRQDLQQVFKRVQKEYFNYIIQRNFGRIAEFVSAHPEKDVGSKRKKEDKILLKGLSSTHTAKEMPERVSDIQRKFEKHFITSDTVFEQDLLAVMWKDFEEVVTKLFLDFSLAAKAVDRDIDGMVSSGEIRRLFSRPKSLKV